MMSPTISTTRVSIATSEELRPTNNDISEINNAGMCDFMISYSDFYVIEVVAWVSLINVFFSHSMLEQFKVLFKPAQTSCVSI